MPFVKNTSYRDLPFCPHTPYSDFYIYSNISELAIQCELQKEINTKCRSIGILRSVNGCFFLSDIDLKGQEKREPMINVSVVYLKDPPPSTVMPYPVQVFGTLQWKNKPVIFANMLQVLTVPMAIQLRSALTGVTSTHLANVTESREDAS